MVSHQSFQFDVLGEQFLWGYTGGIERILYCFVRRQ